MSNKKSDLEKSYAVLRAAMQINEKVRNDFSKDKDKLRNLEENTNIIGSALRTGIKLGADLYLSELFFFAEQNKSILLADATKAQRAKSMGDLPDSLLAQETALLNNLDKLKRKELDAKTPEEQAKIIQEKNILNVEIEAFVKRMQQNFPQYYKLKYQNITPDADAIRASLGPKQLFLEYFVTETEFYLFALSKNQSDLLVLPISKDSLTLQTKRLRRALSDYEFIQNQQQTAQKEFIESSYWFFSNLVQPALAKQQPGIEQLTIVTDGELGHLPFEVFLTQAQSENFSDYSKLPYLLKQYSINYHYSATLWKESKNAAARKNNGQILGFAAEYLPKTEKDTLRTPSPLRSPRLRTLRAVLDDLPQAQSEIKSLSALFEGNFRMGAEANERYFKEQCSDFAVIHLAMHGVLNKQNPIASSLVFTETADSTEDDFLEAWEISKLKLHADLAVLSACETGFGEFQQGEGVLSLARAFMYAGVPSLVVSMWEVNDASTSQIMQFFYGNLAQGMDKSQALRQAKLSYLSQAKGLTAHPAYWSPFVQLGDEAPIKLQAKGGWGLWIALGAAALLLAALLFWRSRRSETV